MVAGSVDLTGCFAVVTGGYAGIGKETVRVLHERGATVVVPARDVPKATIALGNLPRVRVLPLDLADPASIRRFTAELQDNAPPLDLLIDNAGIMATPLLRTAGGHELQLATNHLGHFQLAAELWPLLRLAGDGRGARVIVLTSGGHRFAPGGVDLDDPSYERRPYDRWQAYAQSKTANALFALALDARGEAHGVRAFSVHPGVISSTELSRNLSLADFQAIGLRDAEGQMPPALAARVKTIEQGAATTLWCALSPQLAGSGGVYCEDCEIARAVPADDKSLEGVLPWARDAAAVAHLWDLSERLTGTRFTL